ncbi:MAG TPA: type II toxin-antitoxin system VapC family toxin [Dehalococcoidales bacterium]|nr:type II toxin-antitoxin system VapC family toxin [Dehalococcoidales bacterium]
MQNAGNSSPRTKDYVLDSYVLLAYLEAEPGSGRVRELLEAAKRGNCHLYMCVVNLGEVMYIVERERGLPRAQETLARIDELPIEIMNADRTLTLAAAHLKMQCPIAYADCFAAALSQVKNAPLVTGDPEFQKVKPDSSLQIEWLASQE